VTWQGELNVNLFSGAEWNEGTQGHTPFADIYAVAANLRLGSP
jgi:hypothetical protein